MTRQLVLRLYVGSVSAQHSGDSREGHCPFAIMAPNIKAAAEEARQYAANQWPLEIGWFGHRADLTAVDAEIYVLLGDAAAGGYLDVSQPPTSEQMQGVIFRFDRSDVEVHTPTTIH